ncbi:hypothetical protein JHD48_00610 [Sulfurimonas sp. SAG-AH-194-I05]|nr:hypothetical protein [Sulfurimonas sp. SAG-AH-194-I05]MDF1874228.1 hypothetical protein [Sulfurimonas sp. SAG-AH-194-I05]
MSKKDKIKEDISILRDEYKNYFIVIMTILTGSFTTFYQVMMGTVPLMILLVGVSGVVLSIFVSILFKRKRLSIDEKLAQLEEIE